MTVCDRILYKACSCSSLWELLQLKKRAWSCPYFNARTPVSYWEVYVDIDILIKDLMSIRKHQLSSFSWKLILKTHFKKWSPPCLVDWFDSYDQREKILMLWILWSYVVLMAHTSCASGPYRVSLWKNSIGVEENWWSLTYLEGSLNPGRSYWMLLTLMIKSTSSLQLHRFLLVVLLVMSSFFACKVCMCCNFAVGR